MVSIEGCDYAFGAPISGAALVAAGKKFSWRYAVSDHSPPGRGITAAEYQDLVAHGIEVGLYWEADEGWMLGGFTAGVSAAQNAQRNIVAAGMPEAIPVYFAHDIEPQSQHFDDVDACLAGAASIMGAERIGVYGGRHIIDHCRDAGTARWYCETEAWSQDGHGNIIVADGVHILQYDTGVRHGAHFVGGVNVDLCRALKPIYGQASAFESGPPIEPRFAKPSPISWKAGDIGPQKQGTNPAVALLTKVHIISTHGIVPRANSAKAGKKFIGAPTGDRIAKGEERTAIGAYKDVVVLSDGSRIPRGSVKITGTNSAVPKPLESS